LQRLLLDTPYSYSAAELLTVAEVLEATTLVLSCFTYFIILLYLILLLLSSLHHLDLNNPIFNEPTSGLIQYPIRILSKSLEILLCCSLRKYERHDIIERLNALFIFSTLYPIP